MTAARASERGVGELQSGAGYRPAIEVAVSEIYAKAQELRDDFFDEARARTLEWAADRVESALQSANSRVVTLKEASTMCGYSEQHLARLVRLGSIADLRPQGSKGRIFIRVIDLPVRTDGGHIQSADEHGLASRLLGGTEA